MLVKIYRHLIRPRIQLLLARLRARKAGYSAFRVLGNNMMPTIRGGDVTCFVPLKNSTAQLAAGTIIVFQSREAPGVLIASRIVGIAGDTVELKEGALLVNGIHVAQPYLVAEYAGMDYSLHLDPVRVPDGMVFVMGDCRDMSKDSRHIGPLAMTELVGAVIQVDALDGVRAVRKVR